MPNTSWHSYAKTEALILVLAAEVTVDGRPAVAWMGRQDEPLARGEVNREPRHFSSRTPL
jgi:hypothetical protein